MVKDDREVEGDREIEGDRAETLTFAGRGCNVSVTVKFTAVNEYANAGPRLH
jgi:hypothetical protein